MTIHKEGYTTIALCILFIFVLNAFIQFYHPQAINFKWVVYILSFILFIAVVFVFRNPAVVMVTNEKAILSPTNGRVTAIDEIEETEFLKDRRLRISISVSPIDAYVNRNPIGGTISYTQHHPKNNSEAEHTTIAIKNNDGTVVLRQMAGSRLNRIATYVTQGSVVEQGMQFGYIKFGSKMEVFLPVGTKLNVELNQAVKGGTTVLGELKA